MENEPVRFFEDLMPGILERTRAALAKQLSCQADDLALVENATSGVNTVLRSLVFERGMKSSCRTTPTKRAETRSISLLNAGVQRWSGQHSFPD